MITVEEVVKGLVSQGWEEKGGSDVWRYLENPATDQTIKVYYSNYETKNCVIVRES